MKSRRARDEVGRIKDRKGRRRSNVGRLWEAMEEGGKERVRVEREERKNVRAENREGKREDKRNEGERNKKGIDGWK